MLFMHHIRDGLDYEAIDAYGRFTEVNKARIRREGLEIEAKTLPLHDISFSGGLTLIRARDQDTGQKITLNPEATFDLGIRYEDNRSFTVLLKGHYVRWNAPADWKGKYNAFICDLFLTKKVYQADKKHLELFLTAHNLFKGSQYYADLLRNPSRWVEAGMRYKF